MSEAVIDELVIKVKADTKDVDKQLAELKRTFGGVVKSMNSKSNNSFLKNINSETKESNSSLEAQQKYVLDLKKSFANFGKSWSFNGTLDETTKKIKSIEQKMEDVRLVLEGQKMGTKGYEKSIQMLETMQNQLETLKKRKEQLIEDKSKPVDLSDFDIAYKKMLESIEAEKSAQKETTDEVGETVGEVKKLDFALASSLGVFRDVAKEVAKVKQNAKGFQESFSFKSSGEYVPRELKEGQRYTKEYQELSRELDKVNIRLENLYTKKERADLSGMSKNSTSYKGMIYDIQQAEIEVENLEKKIRNLQAAERDVENVDLSNIGDNANKTKGTIAQLSTALRSAGFTGAASQISNISKGFSALSAEAVGTTGSVASVASAIPQIALVAGAVHIVINRFKALYNTAKKVGIGIATTIKNVLENTVKVGKYILGIGGSANGLTRTVNKFFSTLRNRGISKVVMQLFSQAKDSLQSLAAFSNRIGSDFNKNVSSLIANFKLLGNSLAAAFEPILNVVTPYLDFLMQKLVDAINVVNQFFSALTGNSTWTKAKYQAVNYGASVEDATKKQKELNKQLQSFDELNNISQNQNSGSGSGSGATSINPNAFTTEQIESDVASFAERFKKAWHDADFSDIGFDFGTAIKNALDGIEWGEIKIAAGKVGKSLATFINGAISVDGLADTLGTTIAQGINTFITGIHGFVTTVNWCGIGTFVGTGIVSAIENIQWDEIKKTAGDIGDGLATGINKLLDTDVLKSIGEATGNLLRTGVEGWWKFVKTFDFSNLGEKIGDSINSFFKTMNEKDKTGLTGWQKLGDSIGTSISGIAKSIKAAIKTVDFVEVGTAIRDMIKNIDWASITFDLSGCVAEIIAAIVSAIKGRKITVSELVAEVSIKSTLNFTNFTLGVFTSDGINVVSNKLTIDATVKFIKMIFGENFAKVIDMIVNWKSWIIGKTFDFTISGMIAKFGKGDDSQVDKTSTGWTAVFGGKPKVNISKKNKKVSGFTALVTGIKDNIVGEGKKSINNITGKVTSLDTSSVQGSQVTMNGVVKVETIDADGTTYQVMMDKNNKKFYYNKYGQKVDVKALGGIFNGGWKSIAQFANGGMPQHGTLALIGENGPEVMGHVGNRTEVLNQSQMASVMYSAVSSAIKDNAGNVNVYLNGDAAKLFTVMREKDKEYFSRTGRPAFSY